MRNIWFCIPLSILYLLILLINNYYFHSSNFKESVNSLLISHFYMISVISLIFFTIGLISFLKKRQSIVAKKFFSLTSVFGIAILTSLLSSYDINIFKAIEVSSIFMLSYLLISFFSNFPVSTKPKYVKIFNLVSFVISTGLTIIYIIFCCFGYMSNNNFSFLFKVLLITNLFLSISICVFLVSLHLRENNLKVKSQLYILIFGIILSFLPIVLLNLIPGLLFGESKIPFTYCLPTIIIFPLTISYLLIKQEVIEFEIRISKWLTNLLFYLLNFLFFNFSVEQFIDLSQKEIFILCSLSVLSVVLSVYIYKLILSLFRYLNIKKDAQSGLHKIELFQTLSKEKHAKELAKLVGQLINQMFNINGVSVIWNSNSIYHSLYETGIFQDMDKFELFNQLNQLEQNYLLKEGTTPIHIQFEKYHLICFPILIYQGMQGAIIIGEKNDYTLFKPQEINELEEVVINSANLLLSVNTLNSNKKEIRKAKVKAQNWKQFNYQIIQSLENERKRLSIFLHDEILQILILQLNEIRMLQTKRNFSIDILNSMDEQLEDIIYSIRKMCHNLHPIIVEDLGLEASLHTLKREFELNYRILIHIQFNCKLKILSKNLEIQIYRIIKELLNNAIKHSKGNNVQIHIIEERGCYVCTVEDDGIGFCVPNSFSEFSTSNHLGLMTIQRQISELNGNLRISSEKEHGTLVTFTIPVNWEENNEYTYTTSG